MILIPSSDLQLQGLNMVGESEAMISNLGGRIWCTKNFMVQVFSVLMIFELLISWGGQGLHVATMNMAHFLFM